MASQVQ